MARADQSLVQGPCKVPLLRGEVDLGVVKYEQIEQRITNDLDAWLCNLYFETRQLDQMVANNKDYEVTMNFSNQLLRLQRLEDESGTKLCVTILYNFEY